MIQIAHHPVPPRLEPYIERVLVIDYSAACGHRWQVMPSGYFALAINLGHAMESPDALHPGRDLTFTGVLPNVLSTWCDRPVLMLALTLTALAAAQLPARPPDMADRIFIGGEELFARPTVRRLDSLLRDQSSLQAKVDAALTWFESLMFDRRPAYGRELTIAETAHTMHRLDGPGVLDAPGRTGLSRRQLEREFRARLGTSPKHYSTVTRVQKFARLAWHGETLAAISAALDFFDQAHMTNVVRDMTGMTPAQLLRRAAASDLSRAMRPHWGGRITHV